VDEVVGEAGDVHRLAELGLRSGTPVEMVQPGNPCIIRVGGSKLCFRESDLLSVLVRLGESA
jgi:Fe2+ transport system protein FeoA